MNAPASLPHEPSNHPSLESSLRGEPTPANEKIAWAKNIPFLLVHLMPFGILWTGMRWSDALWCVGLYYVRMFFITAGYHRYFGHRAYKLGRLAQFVMAFGGGTAVQKGALWWASHHRLHHRYSDTAEDVHSELRKGFFWSHVGWIMCRKYDATPFEKIRDFAKYPELRFLNRYHLLPPFVLAVACYLIGGWSLLFGGFFLSTVLLYHGTFTINSITHMWGRRRYATTDDSRNSFLLSLITLGEGWHNNHHYYQSTANQGFFWWEIDISYYVLRILSWLGVARDLRKPSQRVLESNLIKNVGDPNNPRLKLARAAEATPTPVVGDARPHAPTVALGSTIPTRPAEL
jgi:stearoyl-CoA desaturase (delta-9 desaturase)